MPHDMTKVRLDEMRGHTVYDEGGEKIGTVEELYYDEGSRTPEWIGIGTGFFGTKRVLVPVQGARVTDDGLFVAYSTDHVKDGPDIDEDEITPEHEAELTAHYGIGSASVERSSNGGRTAEQSVTRSEEELAVGKRSVDAGSARLRKWVETEPVALDVELQHEVARVTREPVNEPVGRHDFAEEEVEIPLQAEEAVVQKQAVAKERIGVEKGVETETETVRDEVRKEHVEVQGDVETSRR
jgi:uncharacterized protein (TIGR02271 family)